MAGPRIRVLIVDDHPLIRSGLAAMINAEPDLEHAGEAGSGEEAVRLAPGLAPDVVLMDQVMSRMDGIAATEVLSKQLPHTKFVILTSLVEPTLVRRAMAAGARGFVLKTASARELVAMIRNVHAGRRVLDAEATDALFDAPQERPPGADLTVRERELLALMARGFNNQQIAAELTIGLPTVKFHVTNIFGKLAVDNRVDAVLAALKHKLVPPV
jgi:two-component system, NarL family, response regulator LiaR